LNKLSEEQKQATILLGSKIYDIVYPKWWGLPESKKNDGITEKVNLITPIMTSEASDVKSINIRQETPKYNHHLNDDQM